jgi:hypothetical protein
MTMEAHASGRSSLAKANDAPRCGAKTRPTGQPCKHLARKGSGRCRLHAGRSTGPKSAAALSALKTKMTKHGWFSQEAVAARKKQRAILRALKAAAKNGQTMNGGAGVGG